MKRPTTLVAVVLAAVLAGGAVRVVQDQCGPFTDVTPGFCPFVLELYYLGITAGTLLARLMGSVLRGPVTTQW